jgi:hypothetical protein
MEVSDQTAASFADLLDHKLNLLIEQGYCVRCIFATVSDIERLFIARGESAVMLDCDPGQDRAWYGQFELTPAVDAEQTMVMYGRGEHFQISELDKLPAAAPLADAA